MKIYVAGKICGESEKKQIEKVAELCEELGFETFVPHRDVGICEGLEDVDRIFEKDIVEGFEGVDVVVAVLDGLHVGAGTAWELGYAYAKGIKTIGLKTDESISDALDSLSAILISSVKIVGSFDELEKELINLKV